MAKKKMPMHEMPDGKMMPGMPMKGSRVSKKGGKGKGKNLPPWLTKFVKKGKVKK